VAGRLGGELTLSRFRQLDQFLPQGALFVLNNAQVTPARLLGKREGKTGLVQVLILDPPLTNQSGPTDLWCLCKPGRSLSPQTKLIFEKNDFKLEAVVLQVEPDTGRRLVRFFFEDAPLKILDRVGHIPLPPYIKRLDTDKDFDRYQTVYAQKPGAIAAPTAGLHFTQEHLGALAAQGFSFTNVTLRVGAGTFAPLTEKQLQEGLLHQEFVEVSEQAVKAISQAKREGKLVVAVGTTTARALEWASLGGALEPQKGFCRLFIKPGHEFKTIEALITNFHLPGSSLMLLVAAFMGKTNLLKTYQRAVDEEFRFFSYGDAMLIM
jgi:S-adenosylmethionine:tRNA ribosyltransferase-isomerase